MPERTLILKTKFYKYSQNNTGGSYNIDKARGIGKFVFVEAISPEDANKRARLIGLYFDGYGDCECCGNRWHEQYSEKEGQEVPKIFGQDVSVGKFKGFCGTIGIDSYIHYLDGTIQTIKTVRTWPSE